MSALDDLRDRIRRHAAAATNELEDDLLEVLDTITRLEGWRAGAIAGLKEATETIRASTADLRTLAARAEAAEATLAEATSATMMAEMRADKLMAEVERLKGVTSMSLLDRLSAAADEKRELVEALRPFALFFDAAIEAWSDGHDLDGGDIQEIAASLGLLRETVFNSEVHTDELGVDAQDGDPWFVLSDVASKAIRAARALQAKEVGE